MLWKMFVLPLCLSMCIGTFALAQDQTDPEDRGDRQDRRERGPRGEGRGEGGRFDPEQMRQRMAEALKTQLNATDEEWAVLGPKIENVITAQRNTRGGIGGMMMMGGPGGPGGPGGQGAFRGRGGDQEASEVARAARELRTAVQNENATAQELNERLAAYRAAREKANAELATARAELKDLLTQRQEAVLVMMGVLE